MASSNDNDTGSDINDKICPESESLKQLHQLILLPFAVVITVLLAFIVRRKQRLPQCCWGRPGFLHPIDFIDETDRRWTIAACFIVMGNTILSLFDGVNIIDVEPQNDPEYERKFHWVSVFVKLLNVLLVAVDYYPVFACVTHRNHVVANIVGILYNIQLLVVEIFAETLCPISDAAGEVGQIDRNLRGAMLAYRLPGIICYFIIIFVSIFDLGKKIYVCCKSKQLHPAGSSTQFVSADNLSLMYVRKLVNTKIMRQPPVDDSQLSFGQKLKQKLVTVVEYFRYRKVVGFKYSVRIVGTLAISALAVLWVMIEGTIIIASLASVARLYAEGYILSPSDLEYASNLIEMAKVSFLVAFILAGVVQLVFVLHTLIMYKQRLLALFQGIHDWHVKITSSPPSVLLNGMRYSGYQITYCVVGYLLSGLLLSIIILLFVFFIILPLREGRSSWLIDIIVKILPAVVLALLLNIAQLLLCKFVFLRDGGKYLDLTNRRLYYFVAYFLFLYNAVIGFFSVIKRVLLSLVIGTLFIARMDYVILMKGFEFLDSGHVAYLSMLMVEVYQTHPVLRTFVLLLNQTRASKKKRDDTGYTNVADDTVRRKRLRNRWLVTMTLVNNPSLVFERLVKQYQQQMELAGNTEDDRLKLKDSAAHLRSLMSANIDMRMRKGEEFV